MSSNTGENDDMDQLCGGGGSHGSNSGEIISSKNECISSEQNNGDNITDGINSVAIQNVYLHALVAVKRVITMI